MTDPRALPGVQPGAAGTAGSSFGKWLGIGCGIPIALIVILILAATLWPKADTASRPVVSEPGKYEQTWTTSYATTTCSDWLGEMDSHEQFVAAADMLLGARKADGVEGMVVDSMITGFQGGITNVCVEPTMTITDAAVGLYLTEPQFQP